ncbi:hypothetical protein ACET3Z_013181 [Daucus carota]
MLRTSKHEREALLAARRKLADTLKFLRSKGFTEEQVIVAQGKDGMGMGIPSRDDFGLPLPHSGSSKSSKNPFVDKMKEKAVSVDADTDILPQPNSDAAKPKLWSQVVKEAPSTSPSPCLSYFPPPEGDTVLAPPDEALRKGIERIWVKKSVPENRSPPVAANVEDVPIKSVTSEVPVVIPGNSNLATPAKNGIPVAEDLSDLSATPLQTFQNLRQVDEIDMKNATQATGSDGFQLSKSKRKRLKKSKGKSPSTLS